MLYQLSYVRLAGNDTTPAKRPLMRNDLSEGWPKASLPTTISALLMAPERRIGATAAKPPRAPRS